jgi:hypothetical protein
MTNKTMDSAYAVDTVIPEIGKRVESLEIVETEFNP